MNAGCRPSGQSALPLEGLRRPRPVESPEEGGGEEEEGGNGKVVTSIITTMITTGRKGSHQYLLYIALCWNDAETPINTENP